MPDNARATGRLLREFKMMQEQPVEGISAAPDESNIFRWNGIIFGPQGTPFENGRFSLIMEFKPNYPFTAPIVHFIPPIFHPNVAVHNGWVCINILRDAWAASLTVSSILLSIQTLLNDPNPDSAANPEAAELYTKNRGEYDRRVRLRGRFFEKRRIQAVDSEQVIFMRTYSQFLQFPCLFLSSCNFEREGSYNSCSTLRTNEKFLFGYSI